MNPPAKWLPQAAQTVTVISTHPDYDDTVQIVSVARDWKSRGEDYLRERCDLDAATRIIAVFEGGLRSELGSGVNT